jgi:hypothetical protein
MTEEFCPDFSVSQRKEITDEYRAMTEEIIVHKGVGKCFRITLYFHRNRKKVYNLMFHNKPVKTSAHIQQTKI